jgi:hypothetical protein
VSEPTSCSRKPHDFLIKRRYNRKKKFATEKIAPENIFQSSGADRCEIGGNFDRVKIF